MMNLLVDPLVYVLPFSDAPHDVRLRYAAYLQLWHDEWASRKHEFFISKRCVQALYENGRYPFPEELRRLWVYVGETRLSYDAIAKILAKVLANTPYLEDRISELQDIEVYAEELIVRPDLVCRNITEIQPAFRDSLGRVAYARMCVNIKMAQDLMLLTYPTTSDIAEVEVNVETMLETIDVDADVPLATDPSALKRTVDLSQIWENTTLAIEWKLKDMIRDGSLEPGICLKTYYTDKGFNQSIKNQGLDSRIPVLSQIFRKCVMLLCGKYPPDGSTHHTLDKHRQRIVRGWGAWRMHVTGSPMAYRLHYWRKGDTFILMQVAPYSNLDIADPPEDAF